MRHGNGERVWGYGAAQRGGGEAGGVSDTAKVILLAIAILLLIIGGVYAWINTVDDVEAVIVAQQAVYEVPIEDYQPRQLGSWHWEVPTDAYNRTEERRIHHWNRIKTGESCSTINKQRTCTPIYAMIPDYDTWVNYTADRWAWIYNRTAYYNSSLESLDCPDPKLNGQTEGYGAQRALPCVKHYSVDVIAADRRYTCNVNSDLWFAMKVDTQWTMKLGRFTQSPWCATLGKAT